MSKLTQSKTWQALQQHFDTIKDVHMRDLFEKDEHRFDKFSLELNDILYDFSKNRINGETKELLLQLADEVELPLWIERMFRGEPVNHTENRAVLHTALRAAGDEPFRVFEVYLTRGPRGPSSRHGTSDDEQPTE